MAYDGRVKPLDTLARNSLRILSNKQEYVGEDGEKKPAMRWLLDLIARRDKSDKHRVFRIDYQPLLDALKLPKREGHMYSFEEIMKEEKEFKRQIGLAADVKDEKARSIYQKKVLELAKRLQLRNYLAAAFHHQKIEGKSAFKDLVDSLERNAIIKEAVESGEAKLPLLYSRSTGKWELYNTISIRRQVMQLAKQSQAKDAAQLSARLISDFSEPLAANAIRHVCGGWWPRWHRNRTRVLRKPPPISPRKSNDATLKQVFQLLADASPRDEELRIGVEASRRAVRNLAQARSGRRVQPPGLAPRGRTGDGSLGDVGGEIDHKGASAANRSMPRWPMLPTMKFSIAYEAQNPPSLQQSRRGLQSRPGGESPDRKRQAGQPEEAPVRIAL